MTFLPLGLWRRVTATCLVIASLSLAGCGPAVRPLPSLRHSQTEWRIRDSLAYEAIAFLNALTHDRLVGDHYRTATRPFETQFTGEVQQARDPLASFREQKLQRNLSGFLYPYFPAAEAETLADLIRLVDDPEPMRTAWKAYDQSQVEINVYFADTAWSLFQETLPHLQWDDYGAEDSVRALEQSIEVSLGLEPRWRWTEAGGMHALGAVLYSLMQVLGFPQNEESYQDFIIRMVAEGQLVAGKTEALYHRLQPD